MLRPLHQLSLRLSAVLFVLLILPFAARADGALQSIADQAAQYLSDIQGQYGSRDDPAIRSTVLAEAKKALAAGDVSGAVTGYEQAIAAGEDTAEPWTAWAATVSGSDCQPGTPASAS